ncbi:MAG: hypothetical protein KIT44_15955, partial [Opitutaceae bacterium]|nr:hypothetical protein [Opitutaceae bacterium]
AVRGPAFAGGPLLRDRNLDLRANPEKWDSGAADPGRPERMYSCTDHQGSVVALVGPGGALVEQERYSANGVPFGLPLGDVDADGDCDGADDTLHKAIEATGVYDVRGDLDLDGDVDSADWAIVTAGAGEVLGWGAVTTSQVASRFAQGANESDGDLTFAGLVVFDNRVTLSITTCTLTTEPQKGPYDDPSTRWTAACGPGFLLACYQEVEDQLGGFREGLRLDDPLSPPGNRRKLPPISLECKETARSAGRMCCRAKQAACFRGDGRHLVTACSGDVRSALDVCLRPAPDLPVPAQQPWQDPYIDALLPNDPNMDCFQACRTVGSIWVQSCGVYNLFRPGTFNDCIRAAEDAQSACTNCCGGANCARQRIVPCVRQLLDEMHYWFADELTDILKKKIPGAPNLPEIPPIPPRPTG